MSKEKKSGTLDLANAVEPGSGDGEYEKKQLVAEGSYSAIITDSKIKRNKKDTLDMLVWEHTITDGQFLGEKLTSYHVLSGKGAGFTRQDLLAFHDEDELDSGFTVKAAAYMTKPHIISVKHEDYLHSDPAKRNKNREDGKWTTARVDAVLSPDDEAAQSAVQITLNSEEPEDEPSEDGPEI